MSLAVVCPPVLSHLWNVVLIHCLEEPSLTDVIFLKNLFEGIELRYRLLLSLVPLNINRYRVEYSINVFSPNDSLALE